MTMQDNELIALILIVLILTVGAYFIVRMIYKIKLAHAHTPPGKTHASAVIYEPQQVPASVDVLPPLAPADLQIPFPPPYCDRNSGTSLTCSGNTPGGIISVSLEKNKKHTFTFSYPGNGIFIVYLISWAGNKKFELVNTKGPLNQVSSTYSGLPGGDYYFWVQSEGEFNIRLNVLEQNSLENFFMKLG
jgi:hypothetical protein